VLKELFDEHLADNFGEVLPHVFMAEVFAALSNREPSFETQREEERVFAFLESEFASGSGEVQEMISVSFLQLLPGTPLGERLRGRLGPELGSEMAKVRPDYSR